MDICKYAKIKKVLYKDNSLSRLFKGVIMRKNVANKKMKQALESPRIMVISGSIDLYTNL
jgi:hypothetical protein